MILHNLKATFRILLKNKVSTFINLFGFSAGLSVAFLIFSFVRHELTYDQYHENADHIYRANIQLTIDGEKKEACVSSNILGPKLKDNVPGVDNYVRMLKAINSVPSLTIHDEQHLETRFYFADSTLFDIFSINMLHGSTTDLFAKPEDAMISERTAQKYFGHSDVVGETFTHSNKKNYEIKAVYEDFPGNSHFHPNFIASSLSTAINNELTWDNANYYTYILLQEDAEIGIVEQKLADIIDAEADTWMKNSGFAYTFIPLTDIHLKSEGEFEPEGSGDLSQVYAFMAIALFILSIACINYMNLATSRSLDRAKEVGLKKMMGGFKGQLIFQFLLESSMLTFMSMALAAIIIYLAVPYFNHFIQNPIDFSYLFNIQSVFKILAVWLIISLISGLYPSFVLTAFTPSQVLKGSFRVSKQGVYVRKSLVILQLVISSALIISAIIVKDQMKYMSNQQLGFDKEHILILQMQSPPSEEIINAFQTRLLQHNNISVVSRSSAYPSRNSGGQMINAEGMAEGENMMIWGWRVQENIIDAFGFDLIAGQRFDQNTTKTEETEFIINETGLQALGWNLEDCIGKRIDMGKYYKGYCYGVIKDFHINSLRQKIEPVVLYQTPSYRNFVVIRLGNGDIPTTLKYIESEWQNSMPELAFDYHFLDQSFEEVYAGEQKTLTLVTGFSVFAILIAGLGIFGLSNYEVQARTKEIGIRKALGSSATGIFRLVARNFALLVLISIFIASPIAWWLMNSWLSEFAYRSGIGFIPFILAGGITLAIVLISIFYQTFKAAFLNPVVALRYE